MTRILIIDDDELVRISVGKILELKGYDVRVACDGLDGMKAFLEDPPDLEESLHPGSVLHPVERSYSLPLSFVRK